MRVKTVLSLFTMLSCMICFENRVPGDWTISIPTNMQSFEYDSDISAAGDADDNHGGGFIVELKHGGSTEQSTSGTANPKAGGGYEDWQATLDAPSSGWSSGNSQVVLSYNLAGVINDPPE